MNGVLVVDKPAGMTSHDVVNRVRRITRERSIGHLGTLDPMATGVLPLVMGRLTRLAQFYTGSEKTYLGEIRFGFATDTYDAEGEQVGPLARDIQVPLPELTAIASRFKGIISQTPPPFSAKKMGGVAAYKLARDKKEVRLKAVDVEVKEFEILGLEGDRARFSARVSSGTYMRCIANDIGAELGIGAHLSSLRRTSAGEFRESDARTLEQITESVEAGTAEELCIHPRRVLPEMPSVTTSEEVAAMIRNGRSVNLPELSRARLVKVFRGQTELVAIATRVAGTLFHPKVVFAGD